MSEQGGPYTRSQPILASMLNETDRLARQVGGLPAGTPGAGLEHGDQSSLIRVRVVVVARTISGPDRLSSHGYTVTDGVHQWDIDWTRIIVRVQHDLVIDGPRPQGFVPAEIAGQGLAIEAPWRAWGTLYRGPGPGGGPDYAVELFGVAPHRGC